MSSLRAPHFFGYGSLVNRRTHSYPEARRARLSGFRRMWCGTVLRRVAYLSVVPDTETTIDGLIAEVPGGDWAGLDLRERAYDRHDVSVEDHAEESPVDVQVYRISPEHLAPPGDHPILLSYLDTVLQGFWHEFGAEGVDRFFASTDGWEHAVLDDRASPIYPRARDVPVDLRRRVDTDLAAMAVKILPPDPD